MREAVLQLVEGINRPDVTPRHLGAGSDPGWCAAAAGHANMSRDVLEFESGIVRAGPGAGPGRDPHFLAEEIWWRGT